MSQSEVFSRRLRELVAEGDCGLVANEAGISRETLSRYRSGKMANPTLRVLEALAVVLEVPLDYLLGLTDDPHGGAARLDLTLEGAQAGEYELVPFLRDPIAAGSPVINTGEVGSFYALRTAWRKRNATGRVMFMQVARGHHGESMVPTILPGSILTVDLGSRGVRQGEIYVVRLKGEDGGVTVKRVYVAEGNLICTSDNKARVPIVVSLAGESLDQLVVGKVLRWQSGEE